MKIGIQGIRGAFHHIAAENFFDKEIEIVEYETFRDLFDGIEEGKCDKALVAIENSIAGSILKNYDLLLEYNHWIAGEYFLRIKHNLMALPGQSVSDINIVRSHPMALAQCDDFLRAHPKMKVVEDFDTAGIAKEIADNKLEGVGAIAGDLAADIYDLEILESGIETDENNYTRFLVIQKEKEQILNANKTSIVVELKHKAGSLYEFLGIFNDNNISMTKIESRPIVGQLWKYRFYIDYINNESQITEKDLLSKLKSEAENIQILGRYQSTK